MKRRVVPLYRRPVFFTNDEQEARAFFEAHGQSDNVEEAMKDCGGLYYSFEDDDDKTWRIMCVFDGSISTVAHESTHAAVEILDSLGMKIDFENSEPLCYLVQWFFDTMQGLYPIGGNKPKAPAPIKRENVA